MQLLTFTIAERRYGIDTRRVVELLPLVVPRPLPRQPDEVLGLIRYRGRFLPSIDLGQVIAGSRCRDRLGTRTIVVQLSRQDSTDAEPQLLALVAENVIGIASAAGSPSLPPVADGPFGPLVELVGDSVSCRETQLLAVDAILPQPQLMTLFGLAGGPITPAAASSSAAPPPSP